MKMPIFSFRFSAIDSAVVSKEMLNEEIIAKKTLTTSTIVIEVSMFPNVTSAFKNPVKVKIEITPNDPAMPAEAT